MEIRTIGIDLGKTVFHLVGVNARGEVVVRKKCSRMQLLRFTSNLRACLVGTEACGGSHFLGRALREQGHNVGLMPAQYVKPYVKTNKNDYIDAEAIAQAVTRPTMRFVPIKTDDQLDQCTDSTSYRGTYARNKLPIDKNCSTAWIEQAQNQPDGRGLARAVRPEESAVRLFRCPKIQSLNRGK